MSELETEEFEEELKDDTVIAVALKRSGLVLVFILVLLGSYMFFNREKKQEEVLIERDSIAAPDELKQKVAERPVVSFANIGKELGFQHFSGATGEKLLPETMGGGVAVFDYDNDGDEDLFFTNAKSWPHQKSSEKQTQRLFQNDGSGNFQDVTVQAGLNLELYAMGVAVGDVDNDGDKDLYLTTVGKNVLMKNEGGVFSNASKESGLEGGAQDWSTSAGFFDYDNDGDLDLFVCNYVVWSREIDLKLGFTLNGKDRAYGPPKQYSGAHSRLYRNDGNTFTDVSAASGVEVENPATGKAMGKALAVTFTDLDHDGFLDILVANDTVQNFVFHNKGDGTFSEEGASTGIAFDSMGLATGAMGMDAGYYANDDRIAVSIANFANESTSLFVQQPKNPMQFADLSNSQGIGSPSRLKLSFGLFFFDYDLDGRLDLLQSNGHLEEEINTVQSSQFYRQAAQLFWNTGGNGQSQYVAVPENEVGDLSQPMVGRGSSFGDFDGDGDLDVVLAQTGGAPLLLRNDQDLGHHWLGISLVGTKGNKDAIGALVSVTSGDTVQRRRVMPTRSYLSQASTLLTFGLGTNDSVDQLTVSWPGGMEETFQVDAVDRILTLTESNGG